MIRSTFVIQSHKLHKLPKGCLGGWLWSRKTGVGAHLGTSPPEGVGMGDLMQPPPLVGPRRSSQAICIPSLHCDLFR